MECFTFKTYFGGFGEKKVFSERSSYFVSKNFQIGRNSSFQLTKTWCPENSSEYFTIFYAIYQGLHFVDKRRQRQKKWKKSKSGEKKQTGKALLSLFPPHENSLYQREYIKYFTKDTSKLGEVDEKKGPFS